MAYLKRTASLILAISLIYAAMIGSQWTIFVQAGEAFSEEDECVVDELLKQVKVYTKNATEWDCSMTGFVLSLPQSFHNLKGQVYTDDAGEIEAGAGVFHARLFYVPALDEEREELEKLLEQESLDADPGSRNQATVDDAVNQYCERGYMTFMDILGFREGLSLDEAKAVAWISEDICGHCLEIGQAGECRFYCLGRDYSSMNKLILESFGEKFYEEFKRLSEDAENIARYLEVKEPISLPSEVVEENKIISFVTDYLNGCRIESNEIFSPYKVTMINVWATWCGPCKEELDELEELSRELQEKGCQIIGICDDTLYSKTAVSEANAILAEKGVTYTNLIQTEEIQELLPTSVYPISYFVDCNGKILTDAVIGASVDECCSVIDSILKKE